MIGPDDKTHDEKWQEYIEEYWDDDAVSEKEKDD
jgi:hypothetical protein